MTKRERLYKLKKKYWNGHIIHVPFSRTRYPNFKPNTNPELIAYAKDENGNDCWDSLEVVKARNEIKFTLMPPML